MAEEYGIAWRHLDCEQLENCIERVACCGCREAFQVVVYGGDCTATRTPELWQRDFTLWFVSHNNDLSATE